MKYISTILSVLALFLFSCLLTGLFWFGLPFAGKPALSDESVQLEPLIPEICEGNTCWYSKEAYIEDKLVEHFREGK